MSRQEPKQFIETDWGGYRVLDEQFNMQVKHLTINPGACMSYQEHKNRCEMWNIVKGDLWMCIEGVDTMFPEGDQFFLGSHERHAAYNRSGSTVEVIEVWLGDGLSEDDIVRHPYVGFLSREKWTYGSGNTDG